MQTVVLAAGQGTRMLPITANRPKPMLPVVDRPLVEHTLDAAVTAGATRLILVVGYRGDLIRSYFGSEHTGVPVEYAEQTHPKGTADAVRMARDLISDDPFVVLNGDAVYDEPSLTELFDRTPAVGSFRVTNPQAYGVLETKSNGEYISGVIEKPENPPTDLVNVGAYAFPAIAKTWLTVEPSARGERELTDVLSRTCTEFDVESVRFNRWLDVGRPWELLDATKWKLDELDHRVEGDVSENAQIAGRVVIASGARVHNGVTIEGPAYVGPGATIGPNAYVRHGTVVGTDVTIGHAVEVKNSVLMEGATVGHLSYVGDSVLGRWVNFGAGTIVANLRHDGEPVHLTVKGERVSTGRRKFGVVIGDNAKTGINTSLNAGVTLSSEAGTSPGETIMRDR